MSLIDNLKSFASKAWQSFVGPPDPPSSKSAGVDQAFLSGRTVPTQVETSMEQQGMDMRTPLSPGQPIAPWNAMTDDPRQYQYVVGQNIAQMPRANERISFKTIRSLIDNYDVAQMCMDLRIDEFLNLDWDIVPRDEDETDKYSSEIKQVRAFFEKPDGTTPFYFWLKKVDYDRLAFDALAIYKERTRNGKLGALLPVDGTTLTPLIDAHGRTPKPPSPAYVQWWRGLPWWWATTDNFVYQPERPRTNTPYGLPPVEWMLLHINTDIRLKWFFLQHFTEGTIPGLFVESPDGWTPDQIRTMQNMYDDILSGRQEIKHKFILLPHGANAKPSKDEKFDLDRAQWFLNVSCAGWKVQPAELGFTEKVNKSSGDSQEAVHYRRNLKPSARYYEHIFSDIIAKDFGLPNLQFAYLNVGEQDDRLSVAQERQIYINCGVLNVNEVRAKDLGMKIPDDEKGIGRFVSTASGPVFLKDIGDLSAQTAGRAIAPPAPIQEQQNAPDGTPPQQQQGATPKGTPPEPGTDKDKEAQAEIKRWVQNSLKRVRDGKQPRLFKSDLIPSLALATIWAKLEKAQTPGEVKAAFGLQDDFFKSAGALKFKGEKEEAWVGRFAPDVHEFLAGQSKVIAADIQQQLEAEKLAKDALLDAQIKNLAAKIAKGYKVPTWNEVAMKLLGDNLVQIYLDGADEAAAEISFKAESGDFFQTLANNYMRDRTADLVGKRVLADGSVIDNPNPKFSIEESTRDMLKSDLETYMHEGQTPAEIAKSIQDSYAFSDTRAETIARTETGNCWNNAGLDTYEAGGGDKVTVFDGDYDDACQTADGQIWTIAYARDNVLEHCNCVRSFGWADPDSVPDRGDDDSA